MKVIRHTVIALSLWSAAFGILPLQGGLAADATSPSGKVALLKRYDAAVESPGRYLFAQNKINLGADATYTLTFWAKASQPLRLRISTKVDQAPWSGIGTPTVVELSQEWQKCEVLLNGEGAVPHHTRLQFNYAESDTGEVWIADVRLRPEGVDESAENLIVNGLFENGLTDWHIEGVRPELFQVKVVSLEEANASAEAAQN